MPTVTSILPDLPIDGAHIQRLPAEQYHVLDATYISDSPESIYALYTLRDVELDDWGTYGSEKCPIVFYHWGRNGDSWTNFSVGTFISHYPSQESVGGGFPVLCEIINWNGGIWREPYLGMSVFGSAYSVELAKEQLHASGFESDINANGLPEFSVWYQYCSNGCVNWGYASVHFYEIQPDGSIVDITADLPGEVVPLFQLLYRGESGTLLLYDLKSMSKFQRMETWWIYEWDGVQYQDVTSRYADDIRLWGQERLEEIRELYGNPLDEYQPVEDFVAILLQYEKAGLQEEAIEIIEEITDPIHWPNTDDFYLCWLEVVLETAVDEYERGEPFSVPVSPYWIDLPNYQTVCGDIFEAGGE